jgi:hypothetical protein
LSYRLVFRSCKLLGVLSSPLCAQHDGAVSLTIRFEDLASRFHVGEVIPIELSFKASVEGPYEMETSNYDRSGRLDTEQFHVTPNGRDPLQSYYFNEGFMGGGLGRPRLLSTEPQIMREDLNEWVVLDRPGHYSVYVCVLAAWRNTRKSARGILRESRIGHSLRCTSLFAVCGFSVRRISWQRRDLSAAENPSLTAGFLISKSR